MPGSGWQSCLCEGTRLSLQAGRGAGGLPGQSRASHASPSSFPSSYDSSGASKDDTKERFSQTMEFVEEYLRDVVCQRFPFSDKEKNKLTFEVRRLESSPPVGKTERVGVGDAAVG